jgi:hypothetical protein
MAEQPEARNGSFLVPEQIVEVDDQPRNETPGPLSVRAEFPRHTLNVIFHVYFFRTNRWACDLENR